MNKNMSNLIYNALYKEASAKEAKAIVLLQNYFENSVGVGEHPDIVEECRKLVSSVIESREMMKTLEEMVTPPATTGEEKDGE